MAIKDFKNFHEMLKETVDRATDQPAYRWFTESGGTETVTWGQFYTAVRSVSKSLMALGIEKNDKVNILSYSCYRWVLCDAGITVAGACTVGIYQSNLPPDCRYIINHSDAKVIFAENQAQLNKLLEIRDEIPDIRKVVLFNGSAPSGDWVLDFETFLEIGKDVSDEALDDRIASINPEDPAGIVYTSGTTGVPKGAVLTHDNFTFASQSARDSLDFHEGDETFLFLPLAHVFARICTNLAVLNGTPTTFARSIDTLVDDIKVARPHWFASVPRIYEKIYSKVVSGAESKGGLALKIFNWACQVGKEVSDCKLEGRPIPAMTNFKYGLATKLVFSKLQAALGGRVRWCISGAAPLNPTIAQFFHAAGILVLEGIGMSENMSFTNVNRVDNFRFGWVGLPGPGIEQRIADDGEIMFRGRNVMKEYYKMPEETAETIIEGGWQLTGDLGEIDSENFLRVTGRKKDLIITAGGKNIAPSAIEGVLATSKYINQVCVIGDKRKFLSALVTLDPETIAEFAQEKDLNYNDLDELAAHPDIVQLIENEITAKSKGFASFESVKRMTIVPEFTIENGILTPTMKIKRNVVIEKHSEQIEGMYPKN
jgi:long-chain acyl-CoA synthetase